MFSCGAVYYAEQGGSNLYDHSNLSHYFFVVLFFMLCKEVHASESVNEVLKCTKGIQVVLSCGTVYYALQGGSNFLSCG